MSEHSGGVGGSHALPHQQDVDDGALSSLQPLRPQMQRAISADAVLGSGTTLEWRVKKPPFPTHNEYNRRHHWAQVWHYGRVNVLDLTPFFCWAQQILAKGEEIVRHATDAHKRDFTLEEMQRVETLALSIISEVRKLLSEEHMANVCSLYF